MKIGIFCAFHTYGQQLNQHLSIHVFVNSVAGLDIKYPV
ncbi:MAG: transposase [Arsenophonus sp. NC-PG7-MAG3]